MSRKNKRAQSEYDRVMYNTREFLRGDKVDNLLKEVSKPKYKELDYKEINIKQGEIYYVTLGERNKHSGSEQRGVKPCVIIQNDIGNRFSTTTIVAVVTSENKKDLPTHIKINYGEKGSIILCEQIFTISKKKIHYTPVPSYVLNEKEKEELNKALKVSLGLS